MSEVFQIVPASARTLWFFGVICALMLALGLVFLWFAWASVNTRFEVTQTGLRIRSAVYGRTLPATALQPENATIASLADDDGLRPSWRTNGIGMPGYSAGWFQLRNGRRALIFLTARDRVVHLPTRDGYDLLVSVRDPERFIASLSAAAGSR